MFRFRWPVLIGATTITLTIVGATAAFAYWTTSGAGTGTATVAEAKPLSITQVAVLRLVPSKAQSLSGKVTNPNDFDVNVPEGTLKISAATIDSDHAVACVFETNFKLDPPHMYEKVVPANAAVTFGNGSITLLNLKNVDQLGCQGATITISYSIGDARS